MSQQPKCHAKYQQLDATQLHVSGWMQRYMTEDACNGWLNTCEKQSRAGVMQWDANSQFEVPYLLPPWKWLGNARQGWNKSVPFYQPLIDQMGAYGEGEYQGHWLDELYRMAFAAKVEGFENWAHESVNAILADKPDPWQGAWDYGLYKGKDESGYIGTNPPYLRFTGMYQAPVGILSGMFEMSGMCEVLAALILYYQYTGKQFVLDAVIKCADLIIEKIKGRESMGVSGGPLMSSMLAKLYRYAPKQAYIELAITVCDLFTQPLLMRMEQAGFGLKGYHTATLGIICLANTDIYEAIGDARFLEAAERISAQACQYGMQPHGSLTATHELIDFSGPNKNTEGCVTAWFIMAWTQLLRITGKATYGDLAERAAYNALPGHRSKDGLCNPYYTRPNQLFAVRSDGQGTVMAARLIVECCMGNLGRALPYMSENVLLADSDAAGFSVAYCVAGSYHATSSGSSITVDITTDYPFEEDISLVVSGVDGSTFPLRLRVPAWCTAPQIAINGESITTPAEDGWITILREWTDGDCITLKLPMQVYVEPQANGLISVFHGPLLYALPVTGTHTIVDKWGSFEELPNVNSAWNYLLLKQDGNVGDTFQFERCNSSHASHVWSDPHAVLKVKAVRLPHWRFEQPIEELIPRHSADAPEPALDQSLLDERTEVETISLVPYGTTILRMACLPWSE
jgi:hypothetical protein